MCTLHYAVNNTTEFYAAATEGGEDDDGDRDGDGADEQQA